MLFIAVTGAGNGELHYGVTINSRLDMVSSTISCSDDYHGDSIKGIRLLLKLLLERFYLGH